MSTPSIPQPRLNPPDWNPTLYAQWAANEQDIGSDSTDTERAAIHYGSAQRYALISIAQSLLQLAELLKPVAKLAAALDAHRMAEVIDDIGNFCSIRI